MTGVLDRYLVFSLANEQYAIPLLCVKEVIASRELTNLPQAPSHLKGIMNLRGQVISVFDLRVSLKIPTKDRGQDEAIIIVDLAPTSLGVVVDSIDCVLPLESSEIRPSPGLANRIGTDHIIGVATHDSKLILLIDIAKALSLEDINERTQHVQTIQSST